MQTEKYTLCLYVAGKTASSIKAIKNLEKYCHDEMQDEYTVEIIDLLEHPHLAEREQIIAIPTLIRKLPAPVRILLGDLSDKSKVLVGLNIVPRNE